MYQMVTAIVPNSQYYSLITNEYGNPITLTANSYLTLAATDIAEYFQTYGGAASLPPSPSPSPTPTLPPTPVPSTIFIPWYTGTSAIHLVASYLSFSSTSPTTSNDRIDLYNNGTYVICVYDWLNIGGTEAMFAISINGGYGNDLDMPSIADANGRRTVAFMGGRSSQLCYAGRLLENDYISIASNQSGITNDNHNIVLQSSLIPDDYFQYPTTQLYVSSFTSTSPVQAYFVFSPNAQGSVVRFTTSNYGGSTGQITVPESGLYAITCWLRISTSQPGTCLAILLNLPGNTNILSASVTSDTGRVLAIHCMTATSTTAITVFYSYNVLETDYLMCVAFGTSVNNFLPNYSGMSIAYLNR